MPRIMQLDPHVADLIAAGEVVERPASAVKELVENAIDAGAHSVSVEIQNGGMTFIRVTDDGCGMEAGDAKIAFLRHATSKLRTKDDLAAIGTLGFRGEALAAISAVSRIDLLTRTQESAEGVSLHLEAGTIESEQPAGCPGGTTILVRDLFYNTPARMKFMKSDMAEGAAVFAAVQREALAHPEVSFRFVRDGAELLHTPGDGELMGAIYQVLGRQAAGEMVPVKSQWEKISVSGYVTRPTATRGNRTYQQFFVNGRFIKSRLLSAALEEAYRNQIMAGRFPACVLHLTIPVQTVDVNVHPAKTEVKFLSERGIFDAVHYGVLSALNKTPGSPEMRLPEKKSAQAQPASPKSSAPASAAVSPKSDFFRTMTAEEFRKTAERPAQTAMVRQSAVQLPQKNTAPAQRAVSVFPSEREAALLSGEPEASAPQQSFTLPPQPPAETKAADEAAPAAKPEAETEPIPAESAARPAESALETILSETHAETPEQQALPLQENEYRVIGETMDTYILVEQGEQLIFIDKHAAHERILFERLKANPQPVMSQSLLMPIAAALSREEAAAALENESLLEQYGFGVEDFGDGTVLIRRVPADIDLDDAQSALSELAGQLLEGKRLDPDSLRDNLLHTIACKAAIKAGYHTLPRERDALVREVLSREDLKYCPHGRPICTVLTRKQLEKQFKRA